MTPQEDQVIKYLNAARTAPAEFAERYLAEIAKHSRAAEECYREMKRTRSMEALEVSRTLSRSSAEHAEDMGKHGTMGHIGSNGSNLAQRIYRYGTWSGSIAENCYYGNGSPLDIVLELLIDDGVPSRGHRRNILNPQFRYVGVAIRPHRWFGSNCVQDFATAVELVGQAVSPALGKRQKWPEAGSDVPCPFVNVAVNELMLPAEKP